MVNKSEVYKEIREFIADVPVIETHQHYTGMFETNNNVYSIFNYFQSDFNSAMLEAKGDAWAVMHDDNVSFDEKYSIFSKTYKKMSKTAYAKTALRGFTECWGIKDFDYESLAMIQSRMSERGEDFYERYMQKYHIVSKVVNVYDVPEYLDIIEGRSKRYSKYCKFALPLPLFHTIKTKADISRLDGYLQRRITCLDDYMEAFENLLKKSIEFGIVCLKDQEAYRRELNYKNPTKSEAELAFNKMIYNPRIVVGTEEARPLDDWLFNNFMRLAEKYDLPVQIHTGFQTKLRNDITKANAAGLVSLLELHQGVNFAFLHANYPFIGEMLFLGKNYPNISIDMSFAQMLDPAYSVEIMKRAVMTVPQNKLMAFGGDCGNIEMTIGYLMGAKDNSAYALFELMECGWIDMDEAKELAKDWFYNNPNEFYKLGFDKI